MFVHAHRSVHAILRCEPQSGWTAHLLERTCFFRANHSGNHFSALQDLHNRRGSCIWKSRGLRISSDDPNARITAAREKSTDVEAPVEVASVLVPAVDLSMAAITASETTAFFSSSHTYKPVRNRSRSRCAILALAGAHVKELGLSHNQTQPAATANAWQTAFILTAPTVPTNCFNRLFSIVCT